jgi:adenylylsulfate kinase
VTFANSPREILQNDLLEIYIQASFATCEQRDVKGLYAKAARNEIASFTGKDSGFEAPSNPDLTLNTETTSVETATSELLALIKSRI